MDERLDERQRQRMQFFYEDRRRGFLLGVHPEIFADMKKAGTLEAHAAEIAQQALQRMEALTKQVFERARGIADPAEREAYVREMLIEASRTVAVEIIRAAP
jgi:hypothetical protein